ncbi:DNA replication complex GINS protein, putative [Plasmodium ovale]|nr:DNA replication complex GINS protein, putative [Plasmodium ovale]
MKMSDVFSIFKRKRNKKTKLCKTASKKGKKTIFMNDKSRRKAYVTNSTTLSNHNNSYNRSGSNSRINRGNRSGSGFENGGEIGYENGIENRGNLFNSKGFRENDLEEGVTQVGFNGIESNIVLVDFPKLPIKNIESCEDVYNIFYMRDQYLIGNKDIIINNDHMILLETILDKLDSAINELNSEVNYSTKKILATVHEKVSNLYNSFKNIKNVPPQLSNAYDCFKSNILFVRAKQFKKNYVYDNLINIYTYLQNNELQQDNIETVNEAIYINDKPVSTASFVNRNIVPSSEYIEYLPMKFNPHFIELNRISIYYLFEESINHIIWQKALDELIVVKALADIPYFDLSEVEGFDFKKMKSGQRQWYPLYIAKELSEEGLATVEFPFWFYIDNLKNIYKKEFEDIYELTDLPSPFFFEISSMFLEKNAFKNSTPIETIGQRTPYKYILKVAGLIQDIRQKRIHKIMNKFKSSDIFSEILIINNIQIYETYCVNYLASVFFQKQNSANVVDENFDVRNYLFDPFIFSSYNV